MDNKEQSERLKNYEAEYANYLKAKYFSDKDIYVGKFFEEKTIDRMTIRVSRSYEDLVGYWNEKYAPFTEPYSLQPKQQQPTLRKEPLL
ncbi:unnamed protein product [Lactuca virosa]|uniref:Uncharacterized protein n=1 Tax=Lactuca virosa TaxID=75947 RepID=A0AAU9M6L3_9ASTR|nr:unnamed protein product [Lactuca virosa]